MSKWSKIFVVVWAILVNVLIMGPIKSMGIYFLPFQVDLESSAKQVSMVLSLIYGTYFLTGPLATISCNLIGYKKTSLLGTMVAGLGTCVSCLAPSIEVVYVTLGLCIGSGGCLAITPTYAVVGQLFTDKRPLVNNLVTMGSALSSIPLGLLGQVWIDAYGWRGSVLLMGGLLLNALPCSLAMMNVAARCDATMFASKRKLFDTELIKSPRFILYCVACGFHVASMVIISTYLIRYAQSRDINDLAAAGLSSIIGAVDITLKPIFGYLMSLPKICRISVNRSYFFASSVLVQSVITLMLPFTIEYVHIVVVVVGYATCIGVCGALPITVLSDLFGPEKLPTSLGVRALIVGTFALSSPPLVGFAVDASGRYSTPFYVSSGAAACCGILLLYVVCIMTKKEHNENSSDRVIEIRESPIKRDSPSTQ